MGCCQARTSFAGHVMHTPILQSWLSSTPWSKAACRIVSPGPTLSATRPPSVSISTLCARKGLLGRPPWPLVLAVEPRWGQAVGRNGALQRTGWGKRRQLHEQQGAAPSTLPHDSPIA